MTISDAPARTRAVDPLGSFCVSAPAGSGKTELLIQRYLCLLSRVARPEQVLAITFTRKAAAEMRERVTGALVAAVSDAPCGSEHEQATREFARAALSADRRFVWGLMGNTSRLNIKTIDGFCHSLTQQMPVLSRFGGRAAPSDDASDLYEAAVRDMFALIDEGHPVGADIERLMLHFDNNWEKLKALLCDMLARREQWRDYMGIDQTPDESQRYLSSAVEVLLVEQLQVVLDALGGYLPELVSFLNLAAPHLNVEPVQQLPGAGVSDLHVWRRISDLLLTGGDVFRQRVDKTMGLPQTDPDVKARTPRLKELIEELSEIGGLAEKLAEVRRLPDPLNEGPGWPLALNLSRVLPVLAAQLGLVFMREGTVDHSEVAQSALLALGDDDSPTELALRLDYGIEHILVDEFQDTAIGQYRLLEKLTRGWGDHNAINEHHPRTLMIVGDAMQSIYGFRYANVGLFLKARAEGFNGVTLEHLQLTSNFRSDEDIVSWVNRTFVDAFPDEDNVQLAQVRYNLAHPARGSIGSSGVSLHGFCGDDAKAAELTFVCEQVQAHLEAGETSIAVLGRTRGNLRNIAHRLRSLNIPHAAPNLDTLGHSAVVRDLLSLCRALANPADRLSWLAVLRAPWVGLTLTDLLVISGEGDADAPLDVSRWPIPTRIDNPSVLGQLSEDGRKRLTVLSEHLRWALAKRDRLSLRVWVEGLWQRLAGPACAPDKIALADAENFMQLLELADSEGRGLDIEWLTQQTETRFMSGGDPDCSVQLMTMHKAKGLEFDCVILPGLASVPRSDTREILAWEEYTSTKGEPHFFLAANDRDEKGATLYNYLRHRTKVKRRLENTRLLYVGATRAARKLTLTAALRKNDKSSEIVSPPESSLLSAIWPSFEKQAEITMVEGAVGQVAASARPLRRLRSEAVGAGRATAWAAADAENWPDLAENYVDRAVGTVVHLALEQLSRRAHMPLVATLEDEARWRAELVQSGLWSGDLEEAHRRVIAAVGQTLADRDAGCWVLSNTHRDARSELPLTVIEAGNVKNIVIDRTFVDRETGVRWIVDYKTSEPADSQTLEEFLALETARYEEQLERYAGAMASLGDEPVKTALYFPVLGLLHVVTDGERE